MWFYAKVGSNEVLWYPLYNVRVVFHQFAVALFGVSTESTGNTVLGTDIGILDEHPEKTLKLGQLFAGSFKTRFVKYLQLAGFQCFDRVEGGIPGKETVQIRYPVFLQGELYNVDVSRNIREIREKNSFLYEVQTFTIIAHVDKDFFVDSGLRLNQAAEKAELFICKGLTDFGFNVGAYQGLLFDFFDKLLDNFRTYKLDKLSGHFQKAANVFDSFKGQSTKRVLFIGQKYEYPL